MDIAQNKVLRENVNAPDTEDTCAKAETRLTARRGGNAAQLPSITLRKHQIAKSLGLAPVDTE